MNITVKMLLTVGVFLVGAPLASADFVSELKQKTRDEQLVILEKRIDYQLGGSEQKDHSDAIAFFRRYLFLLETPEELEKFFQIQRPITDPKIQSELGHFVIEFCNEKKDVCANHFLKFPTLQVASALVDHIGTHDLNFSLQNLPAIKNILTMKGLDQSTAKKRFKSAIRLGLNNEANSLLTEAQKQLANQGDDQLVRCRLHTLNSRYQEAKTCYEKVPSTISKLYSAYNDFLMNGAKPITNQETRTLVLNAINEKGMGSFAYTLYCILFKAQPTVPLTQVQGELAESGFSLFVLLTNDSMDSFLSTSDKATLKNVFQSKYKDDYIFNLFENPSTVSKIRSLVSPNYMLFSAYNQKG